MAMDTVTATDTATAIPTSITMATVMGMGEMKIKKFDDTLLSLIKKTTAVAVVFFMDGIFFNI